jgi:dTDP-4-dehydrorhamnose reductase
MKILLTGASGLFGAKFSQIASKEHKIFSIHNQHRASNGTPIQLDISDKNKVENEFRRISPDIVVHAATLTDVDKCELNRDLAWKINVEGTRNVAQATKDVDAFIIYISTDYVFDGEKGSYLETDQPSPINYYGYTKLKAEEIIKKSTDQYCIARTSVIYGASPAAGKINFALWLIKKLKNKETARIVTDQWNSPTLNTNLAEMTLEIAERSLTGTYHLSGATRITRYNFAMAIAETFELNQNLLTPIQLSELRQPAKRPQDSSLNTVKARQNLKNKPMKIAEAIGNLKKEFE